MSNLNIKQVIKNLKESNNRIYLYSQFGKRFVGSNTFVVSVDKNEMFEIRCALRIDGENGTFEKHMGKYIKTDSNMHITALGLLKKAKEKNVKLIQTNLCELTYVGYEPVYFYNNQDKLYTAIDKKLLKMFKYLNELIQGNSYIDSIFINGDCLVTPMRVIENKFLSYAEENDENTCD